MYLHFPYSKQKLFHLVSRIYLIDYAENRFVLSDFVVTLVAYLMISLAWLQCVRKCKIIYSKVHTHCIFLICKRVFHIIDSLFVWKRKNKELIENKIC